MTKLERRSLLVGALAGVGAGSAAGFASARLSQDRAARSIASVPTLPFPQSLGKTSYAQQGEDVVIRNVLQWLHRLAAPTYLDIGAHEPIVNSNTFLLYSTLGSRGVLVEPNPALTPKLRAARPGDVVLEIGIGGNAEDEEADYYLFGGDGQLNTFSKEEADAVVAREGKGSLKGVMKRKLVSVNKVIAEQFPKGAPDLLSIDTEGLDLMILRSLDFARFRPLVICAETVVEKDQVNQELVDLVVGKGYAVRGGSFVNTVFVDKGKIGI